MAINRLEVYVVNLDPTVGSEIQKTRPCLVVSPDEMNHHIRTVIGESHHRCGDSQATGQVGQRPLQADVVEAWR